MTVWEGMVSFYEGMVFLASTTAGLTVAGGAVYWKTKEREEKMFTPWNNSTQRHLPSQEMQGNSTPLCSSLPIKCPTWAGQKK